MRSLQQRSTDMERFTNLFKYITPSGDVNAHSLDIITDMCMSTIIRKIFQTNSSFHVKWRTAAKVNFCFLRVFHYY